MFKQFKTLLALVVVMAAFVAGLVISSSALANEGNTAAGGEGLEKTHKGANLNLFPPPQADIGKVKRPGKPELLEPAYRAQVAADTVTLKWSQVASADAYHLQVATDPNFKWLLVNQSIMKGNSFEVKGLQKNAHYFWRVAALKTDNDPTFMKGWFSLSTFETP